MAEYVPLTDEELLKLRHDIWDGSVMDVMDSDTAVRLITDLRAARERIKELEDGIEAFLSGKNPL